MDLVYHYTKGFEYDLSQLSQATKECMAADINKYGQLLLTNPPEFYQHAHQPYPIKLVNGYESSLYTLPTGAPMNVIATVDEDPIFDQLLVTLMRAVRADEVSQAYTSVAQSLYQDWLVKPSKLENNHNGSN